MGTATGTLWYINWAERTSIRLVSGHQNRVSKERLQDWGRRYENIYIFLCISWIIAFFLSAFSECFMALNCLCCFFNAWFLATVWCDLADVMTTAKQSCSTGTPLYSIILWSDVQWWFSFCFLFSLCMVFCISFCLKQCFPTWGICSHRGGI